MQISFDPRDPHACANVLAAIAALHPEIIAAPVDGGPFEVDAPTAAEAFAPFPDTGGPTGATGGTPNSSAPAGTPDSGASDSASGPTATNNASPSEVDADGLPWDARIHSGPPTTRPKNADGRWRRARGVSDATVAAVIAELLAATGVPVPPTPAAVPVPPIPAPDATAPTPVPPAPPPTPEPAGTESGPDVVTPAPETPAAMTFADLMRKVTGLQTAGKLSVTQTAELAGALGLSGLRDLIQRPDLVSAFDALLPE